MLLRYRDLREQEGIPYSRTHIWRLVKTGLFPRPFKLHPQAQNTWDRDVIREYKRRGAERVQP